jgi:DNA transformation protein and related proteins
MDKQQFSSYVFDQLAGLQYFTKRAMFGGYGLYHDGNIFGVIAGRLYFKTDDESRQQYTDAGMGAWNESKTYYEVPLDVLETPDVLIEWAIRAAEVTKRAAKTGKHKK